jgi:hypothetical protein
MVLPLLPPSIGKYTTAALTYYNYFYHDSLAFTKIVEADVDVGSLFPHLFLSS